MIVHGRRVGNSTRQADAYIQELFKEGVVYVRDHACHPENMANKFLTKIIMNRMQFEHNINCKIVETRKDYIKLEIK